MAIRREAEAVVGIELSLPPCCSTATVKSLASYLAKRVAPRDVSQDNRISALSSSAGSVLDSLFDRQMAPPWSGDPLIMRTAQPDFQYDRATAHLLAGEVRQGLASPWPAGCGGWHRLLSGRYWMDRVSGTFWSLGRNTISTVPADRWDAEAFYRDPLTPGRMTLKVGLRP